MNFKDLQRKTLKLINSSEYRPAKMQGVMEQLGLPGGQRKLLRRVLKQLEEDHKVVRTGKGRFAPAEGSSSSPSSSASSSSAPQEHLVKGSLSLHPHGFGFLALDPEDIFEGPKGNPMEELFIPPSSMNTARHGDRVLAAAVANTRGGRSGQDLLEGEIREVIERGTTICVGILRHSGGNWRLIPDDARIEGPVKIRDLDGRTPKQGFKAVVRLDDRLDPRQPECGVLGELIGQAGEPGVDILSIMRGHGLVSEFPEEVLAEAHAFTRAVVPEDFNQRRDLTRQTIFTIDPEEARDFDDALSVEEIPDKPNWLRVGVHIADVARFVRPGGELDREALRRGTSAYLVDRVVPMLPEHLTNDLCSLVPHQDRLAHSVVMDINSHGTVKAVDSFRSVIHSKQRLTYEQAQTLISGGQLPDVDSEVRDRVVALARMTRKLRKTRIREHALAFEMPEIRCVLDEDGNVTGFSRKESMEAYNVVEECMLMANREVGAVLAARFKTAIYRIHEEPSDENFEQMAEELRHLGLEGVNVSRNTLNDIIGRQMPEPLRQAVTLTLLKNMNRALYSPELGEHFGLAFDTYTHFTSPIRRYPDLVAHRLLLAVECDRPQPLKEKQLRDLCRHCSDREREAAAAEMESHRVKMFQYYAEKLKKGEKGPYPATISTVLHKGVLVELEESGQRGLVPFPAFQDDYYEANSTGTRATGRKTGRVLQMGDPIEVYLEVVDTENHQMDFRV